MLEDLWYKNAIFYCLSVGSFVDANGDGVGDFEGLIRRLDYLAGIGVTALWLMPFQPSPLKDDGYDISDYYGVHPRYGTLGDFVELTQQARARGIRVIIDLVLNHTSDQHPWFQDARRDRRSKYREFYCWSKRKPATANTGMVFPGVQTSTWTYDREARAYYYHRFYDFQPDLNVENPAVQEEFRKIIGFWLELGVSGFRLDAVPFVIENIPGVEPEAKHYEYLGDLHDLVQWRSGDGVLLGEANILPAENLKYFGRDGERMHMILNFQVNQALFHALATSDCGLLAKAIRATLKKDQKSQWGTFLRSHDELDLGRLTTAQRKQVFAAFGPTPEMQLYGRGIRRRLAPMLGGDKRRLAHAMSLLFTLPGTPVLRYGDEIGMGDDLARPERDAVRTPMQWTGDSGGGFSEAPSPPSAVISEGPFGSPRINVADQRRDPESLLNIVERFVRMRKETPELGWGDVIVLRTNTPAVLALAATWRGNTVVTLHNFAAEAREVRFAVPEHPRTVLTDLLSTAHSAPDGRGQHTVALEPYGYRWYRVGPLLDTIRRRAA